MSVWGPASGHRGESSSDDPRHLEAGFDRAMRDMSAAMRGHERGSIDNCYIAALLEFARAVNNDNGIFRRAQEIAVEAEATGIGGQRPER